VRGLGEEVPPSVAARYPNFQVCDQECFTTNPDSVRFEHSTIQSLRDPIYTRAFKRLALKPCRDGFTSRQIQDCSLMENDLRSHRMELGHGNGEGVIWMLSTTKQQTCTLTCSNVRSIAYHLILRPSSRIGDRIEQHTQAEKNHYLPCGDRRSNFHSECTHACGVTAFGSKGAISFVLFFWNTPSVMTSKHFRYRVLATFAPMVV
jgi:hypothetical protein